MRIRNLIANYILDRLQLESQKDFCKTVSLVGGPSLQCFRELGDLGSIASSKVRAEILRKKLEDEAENKSQV